MDIQEIMKTGATKELKHRISNCIRNVQSEHWKNYRGANGDFTQLGIVIKRCEKELADMKFLLDELHKLDERNR